MRWIRFSSHDHTAYGILDGDRVSEVAGDPFGGYEITRRVHAVGEVKIEVPIVPRTFYCVGLNYAEHIREAAAKLGIAADLPKQPDVATGRHADLHGRRSSLPDARRSIRR